MVKITKKSKQPVKSKVLNADQTTDSGNSSEPKARKEKVQEDEPKTRTSIIKTVVGAMDLEFGPKDKRFEATMQEVKERTTTMPVDANWPKTEERPEYFYEIFWAPSKDELERFNKEAEKIHNEVSDEEIEKERKKLRIKRYDFLYENDQISYQTREEYEKETQERVDQGLESESDDGPDREYVYVEGNDDYYNRMDSQYSTPYLARPNPLDGEDDDDYKVRIMGMLPWSNLVDDEFEDLKEKIMKRRWGLLESLVYAVEDQWFRSNGWHFSTVGGRGYGQTRLYLPAEITTCKWIDEEVEMLRDMLQRHYQDGAYMGLGIDDFGENINEDPEKPCDNLCTKNWPLSSHLGHSDWDVIKEQEFCNFLVATLWRFE